jgi:plastocyanin
MTANSSDHHRRHCFEQGPRMPRRSAPCRLDRRATLAVLGASLVGSLTGCLSSPSFPDADIIAGADSRNVFEPAELRVQVGESVTWGFASGGHNVCCRPHDNDDASLPADAKGFASYGPDESPEESLVPRGDTYEHTFDVAGQYDYVCIPHESSGMTGTIHVE